MGMAAAVVEADAVDSGAVEAEAAAATAVDSAAVEAADEEAVEDETASNPGAKILLNAALALRGGCFFIRSIRVIGIQRLTDLDGRLALIERIEMNPVDSLIEQIPTLLDGVTDAGGMH